MSFSDYLKTGDKIDILVWMEWFLIQTKVDFIESGLQF